MARSAFTLLSVVVLSTAAAVAEEMVLDFERHSQEPLVKTLSSHEHFEFTEEVRAGGDRAARLEFPACAEGTEQKRWLELHPKHTDWSGARWFSMELFNPTDKEAKLVGYIVDGDHDDHEEGAQFHVFVNPYSVRKCVWSIKFRKDNNLGNIRRIHIYSEKNQEPVQIIVDNLAFWTQKDKPDSRPSELLVTTGNAYRFSRFESLLNDVAAKARQHDLSPAFMDVIGQESATLRMEMRKARAMRPEAYFDAYAEPIRKKRGRVDLTERERESVEEKCAERCENELVLPLYHAHNLLRSVDRYSRLKDDREQYARLGKPEPDVLIGFSNSMYKVMPKHVPLNIQYRESHQVEMGRREMECFQLTVVPTGKSLKNVRVAVSNLRGPQGTQFPASQIEVDVVGYTQTRKRCDYGVDYVGWWPDPLLPIRSGVDVVTGDAQTWWIRLWCPEGQAPGDYRGTLTVQIDGRKPVEFDLDVHVWDFQVPKHAPIPIAISTLPNNWSDVEAIFGEVRVWLDDMRFRWADTMAKYYMTPDNLYRPATPFPKEWGSVDFELLAYLRDKGTLNTFNLGYLWGEKEEDIEAFRHNYEKARELGLLSMTYAYGWDERGRNYAERIEKVCRIFGERFPEVLTLTTTPWFLDDNKQPLMPSLDACCPLNAGYAPDYQEFYRRTRGLYSWWYTCVWPPHPWPNFFLEYDPHDMRAFTGLLQIGNRPDGFLYYQTTIFGNNDGLDYAEGPYTSWDPISFMDTHGDGRWWYFDKKGNLVPSMVVNNYRDGLEDTAYYMILEHKFREMLRPMIGYVKLERRGDTVTCYSSGDGKQWLNVGELTLKLQRKAYLGLAVTAHSKDLAAEILFDDVQINGRRIEGGMLTGKDIGEVAEAGRLTDGEGGFLVRASGKDIWDREDGFYYAYIELDGDGTMQARVRDVRQYSHQWSKFGIMLRESLEPDAPFAMVTMVPGNDYGLEAAMRQGTAIVGRWQKGHRAFDRGELPYTDWMTQAHEALFNIKKYYWWLNGYTKDPALLAEFRHRLGTLIDSSPYEDCDPWAKHGFGARGLKNVPR